MACHSTLSNLGKVAMVGKGMQPRKRVHTKKSKVVQARSPDVIDELVENDELKDRQKAFCLYYLQRYNATWAYQKAYGADYGTAMTNGPRLLRNAQVKKQLTELKKL